jgi:hypothetical protein
MSTREKYPKFQLQHHFEDALPQRQPGERLIEIGYVDIDYKTFKKNPAERAQLKAAKAQAKYEEIRKR